MHVNWSIHPQLTKKNKNKNKKNLLNWSPPFLGSHLEFVRN